MAKSVGTDYHIGKGGPPIEPGYGGDGPGGRGSWRRASYTGLIVLLAAIVMFFGALGVAFAVRRSLSDDWMRVPLPPVLWWNTAMLAASSLTLELSRRALRSGRRAAFNRWWTAGTLLGAGFLAGQVIAWQQLRASGIHVATSPGSSFFYLLTMAHAGHLLAGMAALVYVDVQALRLRLGPGKRTAAEVSAVYWHFMDGLWMALLAVFVFWG